MKRFAVLLLCTGALACAAEFSGVHLVYVMPMSKGLDQHLVNRLTNEGVFKVVTDPKLADAVFTDRIGDTFQEMLESISPTPEPEAEEKSEKPEKPEKLEAEGQTVDALTTPANRLSNPASNSTFGRGNGTVFLVDAKSRLVLWSIYAPPKSSNSREMNRTASNIVTHLKQHLKRK